MILSEQIQMVLELSDKPITAPQIRDKLKDNKRATLERIHKVLESGKGRRWVKAGYALWANLDYEKPQSPADMVRLWIVSKGLGKDDAAELGAKQRRQFKPYIVKERSQGELTGRWIVVRFAVDGEDIPERWAELRSRKELVEV